MIEINSREIAADALVEIMSADAYNNMALKRILKQNGAMSPRDRAFVTEIVNGTLRNLYYIDFLINKISTIKTDKMKPWILAILRTGVYQICFTDKVPDSAICNEAVNLTKIKGFDRLSSFVNGVLRNIIRKKDTLVLPDEISEPISYLSIKYSHPVWLINMWLSVYDYDFVKALCEKNNESPDVTVRCNTLKLDVQELKKELTNAGVSVKNGILFKDALHLSKTADIGKMDSFKNGHFHVQDESSMLAVHVLDPQKGERILDLCAAPGGKSFLIGEKMDNSGEIISGDVFLHKVKLIEDGAERLGISIINAEFKDASVFQKERVMAFDRVLIDAPCSGLGLIRKKPDICFKKNGDIIDTLEKLQKEILEQASFYVNKGGVLVYSTCTICKKENIKNIEWFLKNHEEYKLEDITELLPENLAGNVDKEMAENGMIQLFPHIHDTDGFFIARMRRER